MTVTFDLTNVLIASITCLISVLATWFFSRRHYTRASRRQTVSENEITLQEKQNEFRLNIVLVLALLLAFAMLIGSSTYCMTESDRWDSTPVPTETPPLSD